MPDKPRIEVRLPKQTSEGAEFEISMGPVNSITLPIVAERGDVYRMESREVPVTIKGNLWLVTDDGGKPVDSIELKPGQRAQAMWTIDPRTRVAMGWCEEIEACKFCWHVLVTSTSMESRFHVRTVFNDPSVDNDMSKRGTGGEHG